jgi:hypothetical protein
MRQRYEKGLEKGQLLKFKFVVFVLL